MVFPLRSSQRGQLLLTKLATFPVGIEPPGPRQGGKLNTQGQIQAKLTEEIKALNGVKFQLALKIQLRKDKPDGSEEYVSPVMRPKQGVALQNSEIDGALNQAFPAIQETLEKWTQRVRLDG